ncbi:arsenic resistance protein [Clostridium paraputrificum]|uniref:arsenic resistance protein n=1 Tax=Clostridium paraputrificum TaxID=29363 RepID=UPI003D3486C5
MDNINKFQSLIIVLMAGIGILLGQFELISEYADLVMIPALTIMLFLVFIQIPLKGIAKAFKNIKFTLASLCTNFIWTPILIFILGKIFLSNSPELLIGFVMLMVTPCTDWYLIFTALAKGNVTLATSILPLNFLLQLMLLPVYIIIISGSNIQIDIVSLANGLLISLLIPLIGAIIFRKVFINRKGTAEFEEKICGKACDFQGYFLNISIVSMFASQGNVILENPKVLLQLLLPILLFFAINFVVGQILGRKLRLCYEDNVALNLTTLARNSPIALAIAVSSFPDKPIIALALIIGPLIELPVLFFVSKLLIYMKSK